MKIAYCLARGDFMSRIYITDTLPIELSGRTTSGTRMASPQFCSVAFHGAANPLERQRRDVLPRPYPRT